MEESMLETLLTNGLYNQADSPLQNQLFLKILIILASVLLLTVVGGVLIGWILEPFQKQLNLFTIVRQEV